MTRKSDPSDRTASPPIHRRRFLQLAGLLGAGTALPTTGRVSATSSISTSGLDAEEYDQRRTALLEQVASQDYSPASMTVKRHLAALWLEKDVEAINDYLANIEYGQYGGVNSAGTLYWVLPELVRIYKLFGPEGDRKHLLTEATQRNLLENVFLPYFETRSPMFTLEVAAANILNGTENHDFLQRGSTFLIAGIMHDQSLIDAEFPDSKAGGSFEEFHARGRAFFLRKFYYEATHGLWIEGGGPYRMLTLPNYYNVRDFAEDDELSALAELLLDIIWLDYAHLTLNGVRGGPKARVYEDWDTGAEDPVTVLGQVYFGFDSIPGDVQVPGSYLWPRPLTCLTNDYRPPDLATDIVTQPEKRGSYEYVTRFPGVGWWENGRSASGERWVRNHIAREKSVLNYAYCTPEFIMGSFMQNPVDGLTKISTQNRWEGTVFGSGPRTRIQTHTRGAEQSLYMEFATMQQGPITITKHDVSAGTFVLDLYPSPEVDQEKIGSLTKRDGWLFGRSGDGFYGLRAASGRLERSTGRQLRSSESTFLIPESDETPLIVHAGTKADYGSFEAFQEYVTDNDLEYDGRTVTYADDKWGELAFTPDEFDPDDIRLVDGDPIEYDRPKLFDSPYLDSDWKSGLVTATFDGTTEEYDFRPYEELASPPPTVSTTARFEEPTQTATTTPTATTADQTTSNSSTDTTTFDTATSDGTPGFSVLTGITGIASALAARAYLTRNENSE